MSTMSGRRASTGFATGVLSLRGLLALAVATFHTLGFTIPADYSASALDQPNLVGVAAKTIGTAVNVPLIFFVISGLAIARSLDSKQEQGRGTRPYLIFVIRRVLRLYPAYIAATLGVLILARLFLMGQPPLDPSMYPAMGYDYFVDWLNGSIFNPLKARTIIANFAGLSWSMNLVIWSLYVEVCAILLLPLFHRIACQKNPAADLAVLVPLVVLSMALWRVMAVRYLFAFYLGMLVQTRGQDCVPYLVRRTGGTWSAMACAWAVIFATCVLPTDLPASLLIQSLGAFVIISLLVWPGAERPFACLDRRWMQWNGRLSYSFYLWHFIVLTVSIRSLYAAYLPPTTLHRLAVFTAVEAFTVAVALAAAQLSYSYIEEPFIRWGHRLERWRLAAGSRVGAAPLSSAPKPQAAD